MAGNKKPEHMTSLSGSAGRLVKKTHPRIVFRGIIDSLEAEVIETQVVIEEFEKKAGSLNSRNSQLNRNLEEVLEFLRAIMAAEVKETPLPPPFFFGMNSEALQRESHDFFESKDAPLLPTYKQGRLAARLNLLRTKAREAEIAAVRAFGPGEEDEREDIILALNRLSSAFWILYCHHCFIKRGL